MACRRGQSTSPPGETSPASRHDSTGAGQPVAAGKDANMKVRGRLGAVGVAAALVVGMAGCKGVPPPVSGPNPSGNSGSTRLQPTLEVLPARLEFIHVVGETGCFQRIGEISIRNFTTTVRSLRVS